MLCFRHSRKNRCAPSLPCVCVLQTLCCWPPLSMLTDRQWCGGSALLTWPVLFEEYTCPQDVAVSIKGQALRARSCLVFELVLGHCIRILTHKDITVTLGCSCSSAGEITPLRCRQRKYAWLLQELLPACSATDNLVLSTSINQWLFPNPLVDTHQHSTHWVLLSDTTQWADGTSSVCWFCMQLKSGLARLVASSFTVPLSWSRSLEKKGMLLIFLSICRCFVSLQSTSPSNTPSHCCASRSSSINLYPIPGPFVVCCFYPQL